MLPVVRLELPYSGAGKALAGGKIDDNYLATEPHQSKVSWCGNTLPSHRYSSCFQQLPQVELRLT
jgi:hypothetical protein